MQAPLKLENRRDRPTEGRQTIALDLQLDEASINSVQITEQLLLSHMQARWFRVKNGVRQGCVLSPYLFNILVKTVMKETLNGFQGGLQIGGQIVTNLCYADDIILLATSEPKLQ